LGEAELHVALVDDAQRRLRLGRHEALERRPAAALDDEEGAVAAVGRDPGLEVLDVLVAEEDGALGGGRRSSPRRRPPEDQAEIAALTARGADGRIRPSRRPGASKTPRRQG
jgi:hypothetical protein